MAFALFFDEDLMVHSVIVALRRNGVDCMTVAEADRRGMSDESHLEFAATTHRTVVTANRGDFARLHSQYLRASRDHAGIVVLTDKDTPVGVLIAKLIDLQQRDGLSMRNAIVYLNARPLEDGN